MKKYVSIVGFKYYCGKEPFVPGLMLQCVKEPYNPHDSEAIRVVLPNMPNVTLGYVANSVYTTANGTYSAGRLYDKVGESFPVKVKFVTNTVVIAKIIKKGKQ